jgi:two-component system, NarL family, nitrate/nitrite response regulator NarL
VLSTLIVDDEGEIRHLLRIMIEYSEQDLEVAGEAADGEECLRMWRATAPDVVVLDQQMPGLSGLEVAEIILGERPDQAIVLFTANADAGTVESAADLGVMVVGKPDWTCLVDAIRSLGP